MKGLLTKDFLTIKKKYGLPRVIMDIAIIIALMFILEKSGTIYISFLLIPRLLRKFCVSEFRQNQGFHIINVHNDGLFPLTASLPIERDGMRAARGVNAVALYRES